uniref:RING-type domain-containing protein n=2 Tax=Caenorhabditis tropicalis TaxID=1561998 RepID=A0A1I7THZ5_9PELO
MYFSLVETTVTQWGTDKKTKIKVHLIAKSLGTLVAGAIPLFLMATFQIENPIPCFIIMIIHVFIFELLISMDIQKEYRHLVPKPNPLVDRILITLYASSISIWIGSAHFKFILIPVSKVILWAVIGIRNTIQGEVVLDEEEEYSSATVSREEIINEGLQVGRAECGVCYMPYNVTSRTPRILRSCGHSVCERCAFRLQARKTYISCPFCTIITPLNGNIELPKNYALLNVISQ